MSRRPTSDELEFGSDSFLDIIANIVGILIILIVIAGVKVARQPPESADVETVTAVVSAPEESSDQQLAIRQAQLEALLAEARRMRTEIAKLEETQDELQEARSSLSERSRKMVRSIESMESLQTTRQQRRAQAQHQLTVLHDQTKELETQVAQLTASLDEADTAHRQLSLTVEIMEQQQTQADESLQEIEYETLRLKEVLETMPVPEVAEADRLTHRLSPVARSTNDEEIHFRLNNGHIAWVPLEPLLDQLRDQVRTRGSVINRFGSYEGVVGPTGGFLMKYTVERQPENPMQALAGRHTFKVGVSRWEIRPSDTLIAEPAEQALRIGSQFRQILEAADPDTTVTIWLYAKDFAAFGPLREFAHSLGLSVAARPLPDDTEITGSPAGSKSSAQ